MNAQIAERRPLGALGRMGVVAGLHAGALYLIAASLGIVPALKQEPVIPTELIQETRPPDDTPPPPPRPILEQPTLIAPTPVVLPTDAFELDAPAIEFSDDPPVIPPSIDRGPTAVLTGVRLDGRHPLTRPAYPPDAIRAGKEGSVELEVYVLPSGRIGDVRVLRSAGMASLDRSAMEEAKRRWRLLPATRDGEPFAQWHRLKVTFDLNDR